MPPSRIIELDTGDHLAVEFRENRDWDQGFGENAVYVRLHAKHPSADYLVTYLQTAGDGPQFVAGERFLGFGITIDVLTIDSQRGSATIEVQK